MCREFFREQVPSEPCRRLSYFHQRVRTPRVAERRQPNGLTSFVTLLSSFSLHLIHPPDQARAPCSFLPDHGGGQRLHWPVIVALGGFSGVPCPPASHPQVRPRTGFLFPSLRTQPLGVGSRLGLSWPPGHRPLPDLILGCPRRLQGGSDLTFQSSVASLHLSLPSQLDSSPAPTLPLSRVSGPASSRRGGPSGCWRGGSRDPTGYLSSFYSLKSSPRPLFLAKACGPSVGPEEGRVPTTTGAPSSHWFGPFCFVQTTIFFPFLSL